MLEGPALAIPSSLQATSVSASMDEPRHTAKTVSNDEPALERVTCWFVDGVNRYQSVLPMEAHDGECSPLSIVALAVLPEVVNGRARTVVALPNASAEPSTDV